LRINWKDIKIKELAAIVTRKLKEGGIDVLLVGGACVSIYTKYKYVSYDLDFVSHALLKQLTPALSKLGFQKESSRHFVRKGCPFFIEFVSPPAAIGNEPVTSKKELKTRYGSLVLLTPTDTVKDRLAASFHWNDPQAMEQAIMVARAQKIDLKDVQRWSEKEGFKEKYTFFLRRLKQ
jgi:hypothetical protein